MPLNVFDFDSIRMNADRKARRVQQRIVQRFTRPEIESGIGELWQKIKRDAAVYDSLQQAAPEQVKQMEVRYGKSE